MYRLQPLYCFAFLSAYLIFSGCRQPDKEKSLITFMTERLDNTNEVKNISTIMELKTLEEKTLEFYLQEKALEWYPKAQEVASATKKIKDQLSAIRTMDKIDPSSTASLIRELFIYRDSIKAIDSTFITQARLNFLFIQRFLWHTTGDSTGNTHQFREKNKTNINGYLAALESDIKTTEFRMVHYCNARVATTGWVIDSYSAIIGQNSSVLEPGGKLIITAGMGSYSQENNPAVHINKQLVPINDYGFSEYIMKAPLQPGKYKIPVSISFMNKITGKQEYKQVNIEYTVANKCPEE